MKKDPIENEVPKYRKRKRNRKLESMSKKHLLDLSHAKIKELENDIDFLFPYINVKERGDVTSVFFKFFLEGIDRTCDELNDIIKALEKWI